MRDTTTIEQLTEEPLMTAHENDHRWGIESTKCELLRESFCSGSAEYALQIYLLMRVNHLNSYGHSFALLIWCGYTHTTEDIIKIWHVYAIQPVQMRKQVR
jgi:hypothetical protein